MTNWDDNDLENVSEENLRYFYEEFSSSVRKQLLAKNLLIPQNVYDVLYPRTKEILLAKNSPKFTDLEENSKTIRDALIAKMIGENSDIEKLSEDTRNSLLARNKIIQDANDLLNNSDSFRKSQLSKNTSNENDLLGSSDSIRHAALATNKSEIKDTDELNDSFRNKNIAKNVTSSNSIEDDSLEFRKNNVGKNTVNSTDLEQESEEFRKNNIHKNQPNSNDLESLSAEYRTNNQSKNDFTDPSTDKTLENSNSYRDNNVSKNKSNNSDLETDSSEFRKNNISSNTENNTDLELDSKEFRRNNQSGNVPNNSDLESDSNEFRKNNTSANKSDVGDLLSDSADYLQKSISANKPDTGDLLNDSQETLKHNLANNTSNEKNILQDSEAFRKNNVSVNKADNGDLLADSTVFLNKNISVNKADNGDLLNDSAEFLQKNISTNKADGRDLLTDSSQFLNNNVSANKPDGGDLLADSANYLQNNVSANKPDTGDLLADSSQFLENNVSANKPDTGDLLLDSANFLQNNVSANTPEGGDLLLDSAPFLDNNISANVPSTGDLLADSEQYLDNNVSANVPTGGDLLTDSEQFLDNNISANVPTGGDLLTDSEQFLDNNVSGNVPIGGDLLNDSTNFYNNNISANVPVDGDLLNDSNEFYKNNVSANVSTSFDLDAYSIPYRKNNLAANPPPNGLGVIVEGIGTATFLGVSRVLTQGLILRQVLLSKNQASKNSIDNFISISTFDKTTPSIEKDTLISKNTFQINKSEYDTSSANLAGGVNRLLGFGYFGETVKNAVENNFMKMKNWSERTQVPLQEKYGTNNETKALNYSIGGGFFSVDSISPQGGYFAQDNAYTRIDITTSTKAGSITDAIRNYNLSRNLYNLHRITPGDLQSLSTLQGNNDEGFQDLIAKTIGHLRGNDSVGSQLQGNLVPRAIVVANEGGYIKGGSPENLLRPQQVQGMVIGTAESMMAQTVAGNPLMDVEFQAGTKGVKHIIKTIRNSDASKFSINYDVQNSKKYVIGTNGDGTPKIARQRFTIANPYKPGNAKTLLFYLQNYSSGQGFYFPPYIQSYNDSYGSSFNSINFLGRPEAVFTYNNSTRDGSISFVVLTDYTQNLIIGRDFSSDSLGDVKINPTSHFTSKDVAQNNAREMTINQSEAKQKETNDAKKSYQQQVNLVSGGTPESNVLQQDINSLQKQANSIQNSQEDALVQGNRGTVYSETNSVIGNINDFMTSVPSRDAGDIDTKAESSKKRIDEMIKNLSFQPAFFSGDKIDFATKMDFLAKLTRPARADEGSGFSFSRPPICRIRLGDWWNNDIVIDSVTFNYDDVPWTLDEGRVQPMWANVNINFKFIGPYGGQQGGPVLSDDKGGFYQRRT